MNKQKAAEFLEIGVRSLERYMAHGRVAYVRQRGKTGEVVDFRKSELQRFKEELHSPTHQAAVEVRQASSSNSSGLVAKDQIMAEIGESLVSMSEGIDALSEAVFYMLKERTHKIPVENKPLLTLAEAQQVSGLSRKFLLEAIQQGRLKAEIIGKAWRVKRRDLDRFISKLF